jgi:hypothetical protein
MAWVQNGNRVLQVDPDIPSRKWIMPECSDHDSSDAMAVITMPGGYLEHLEQMSGHNRRSFAGFLIARGLIRTFRFQEEQGTFTGTILVDWILNWRRVRSL